MIVEKDPHDNRTILFDHDVLEFIFNEVEVSDQPARILCRRSYVSLNRVAFNTVRQRNLHFDSLNMGIFIELPTSNDLVAKFAWERRNRNDICNAIK